MSEVSKPQAMHFYDEESAELAIAIVKYAMERVKMDPPPLDKPRRPEPVNGWLCRGVTCLEPMADLSRLISACKDSG